MVSRVTVALAFMLVALGCLFTPGRAEVALSALDVSGGAAANTWVEASYVPNQVPAKTNSYMMDANEAPQLNGKPDGEFMLLDDASKGIYASTMGGVSTSYIPDASPAQETVAVSLLESASRSRSLSRQRGFFDRVNNFIGKVGSTVNRVATGVGNFVNRVVDGINNVREKVSSWVGNAVSKAQEWGASLGGKIGNKISEIAGNIGAKYDALNEKVKITVDKLHKRVTEGVDSIGGRIANGLDKASKWLDVTFGNREKRFEFQQNSKMATFQGQQWTNIKFLHDQLGLTQDKLLGYIKQLRDQAGGFREGGSLPHKLVVATKDGKQVVVGAVQGGVTPLVQYTGAPQGAGIYVAKDGTAYTSGGVILPRHAGKHGPQAYVGPNGIVYNSGPYPSTFFFGSHVPKASEMTSAPYNLADLLKRGGIRKLFGRLKDRSKAKKIISKIGGGESSPKSSRRRDKSMEYPDLDKDGRPLGEGWKEMKDERGKTYWTRETVFKDAKSQTTTSGSSDVINSSTKGLLGGHYDKVKGSYDKNLVDALFGAHQAEESRSAAIGKSADKERKRLGSRARRANMASDRYGF